MVPPKKLSFKEVIENITPFFVDENFERQFDEKIKKEVLKIIQQNLHGRKTVTIDNVVDFIRREEEKGLRRLIYLLDLSQEKFLRIITLLRKLDGTFDTEWDMKKIVKEIRRNDIFAKRIANLLINGSEDPLLKRHLPLFYRERLNLTKLTADLPISSAKIKLKDKYSANYANDKGRLIQGLVEKELKRIRNKHGIPYQKEGKTKLIDDKVDFAIPTLENPYVIIMCYYMETTSSQQTTKARSMVRAYEKINHWNIERNENRAFVNFVDGAGWLARQSDLRRLVKGCHYILTIKTLYMLENIVLYHIPESYRKSKLF